MEHVAVMSHPIVCEETTRDPLIVACQQGDQQAFQLLFERHKDRVYSIALYYSANEATAHDIAQQVFLKLFTRIQQFNWQSAFHTWLYRLVANTCYDEQRRWRRWLSLEDVREVTTFSTREDLDASLHQDEVATAVQTAIGTLSPKLRMPILLKYIEGLSYAEIAQVLGCSMGTVASRLNRGHKALAGKLGHLRERTAHQDV